MCYAKPQQHGNRGPCPEAVIFQARTTFERKEQQDDSRPGEQQQSRLLARIHFLAPLARGKRHLPKGEREKETPREQPYQVGAPPCPQRYGAVVMRKARAQSTVDVLVDEIGPEESGRAQSRQDVPRCGDRQKNRRG